MKTPHIIRQKGFLASSLTTSVIWTVLTIIAIASLVLFVVAVLSNYKNSSVSNQVENARNTVVQSVSSNHDDIVKNINTIVNKHISSSLSELEDFEAQIQPIKSELKNVKRVLVSSKPLNEIKPKPYPEINFATLDQLKRAKAENQNPLPEIHLYGNKDQYFNFTHTLNPEKEWYLIISVDPNELFANTPPVVLEEAQVSLIQKDSNLSGITLKSWGQKSLNGNASISTSDIPNSVFAVKSQYIPANSLLGNIGIIPGIAGALSSLMLLIGLILFKLKQIAANKLKEQERQKYIPVPQVGLTNDDDTNPQKELAQLENQQSNQQENFMLDKNIFRAYDIRGIVDESLNVEAVRQIGQAIGTENLKRGRDQIVVARDGRLSGPKLLEALIEGLVKSGNKVINIGSVPTGVLYFATHHLETGSGVMLTGSHNPPNYNGLKIMLDGETLAGKLITDLYQMIILEELGTGDGSVQEMDIVDDYVDHISSDIQLDKELKVVVDAGNGIGGEVGPQVLEEIGCEVIPLHCDVDGSFPNHHPDPSVPKNLEDLIAGVKAADADIGLAFDGDADRLGVVTKEGEIIYSDRILMLFAKDVLSRNPGASIIFDVKCTGHLPKVIHKAGGLPLIWKTGHSFMKAKLKETGAALAGEMSGHFFFKERWFGFDDGIYAAARLLEILDQEDRPAKEVFDELPDSVSTPELNCKTKEGENYKFMEKFKESVDFPEARLTTIDGIRADFIDGWGLVRCSNTTPCLVMRFDADDEAALERIKAEFKEQILKVDDSLNLPF